jgi:hypothetical protein
VFQTSFRIAAFGFCLNYTRTSNAAVINRIMTAHDQRLKYTPEQITEIVERIAALRLRWLHSVKNRLASQQGLKTPIHNVRNAEAASQAGGESIA